jgi:hypothetical protein
MKASPVVWLPVVAELPNEVLALLTAEEKEQLDKARGRITSEIHNMHGMLAHFAVVHRRVGYDYPFQIETSAGVVPVAQTVDDLLPRLGDLALAKCPAGGAAEIEQCLDNVGSVRVRIERYGL